MTTGGNVPGSRSIIPGGCGKEPTPYCDDGTPDLTCSPTAAPSMTHTENRPSPLSLLNSDHQNVKLYPGEQLLIKKPDHPETRDDSSPCSPSSTAVVVVEDVPKRDTGDSIPTTSTNSTAEKRNESERIPTEDTNPSKSSPDYLDESTLQQLKNHLKDRAANLEFLEEDAMEDKMVETNRFVAEQIGSQAHANLCDDSEEEGEGPQRTLIRKQEENFVLAESFFKQTASTCQRSNGALLDKRTLSWLRRAMGIRREKSAMEAIHGIAPLAPTREEEEWPVEDSAGGTATASAPAGKRRLTRSRARSTRVRRREERLARENQGLEALLGAITDLEAEMGPMETLQRKTIPKTEKQSSQATRRRPNTILKEHIPRSTKRQRRESNASIPATLMTVDGKVVHVKVGGARVVVEGNDIVTKQEQGLQNECTTSTVVRGRPRRHIPLTDQHFLIWFQRVESRKRRAKRVSY